MATYFSVSTGICLIFSRRLMLSTISHIFSNSAATLFIFNTAFTNSPKKIPFSCWPQELKSEFGEIGLKLDLSPLDRTNDSWGFIDSNGSYFELNSYRSVTPEEFQIIQDLIFKIELSKR